MRAVSTNDVPLAALQSIRDDVSPALDLEVEENQFFLKAAEPPSWVVLLEHASTWVKVLGGYAALYIAKLVEEAAKETWANRSKAFSAVRKLSGALRTLAESVARRRAALPPRTKVFIGVPIPSEFDAARLQLQGADPQDLALQIAVFVHHLPGLADILQQEGLATGSAAAGIWLEILSDGSLAVNWQDNSTLEYRRRVLRLSATVNTTDNRGNTAQPE